jgi:xylulokinase
MAYRKSDYLSLPFGQREQSAEGWWQNLCSAAREILDIADIRASAISGIGICGFHHCPVLLKEDGRPARPVILLHDIRLIAAHEEMRQSGLLDSVESATKSMVSAGHFPPIIRYLSLHEAEVLENTRWILLPKDYLRYKLTGRISTEICDATGTNLIEPESQTWSEDLCRLLSIPPSLLPEIGNSGSLAGEVTETAAHQSGLAPGTPVVYGGGDSHCALLGLGCIDSGETGMLLGTNSTLRTVFDRFVYHPKIRVWVQHHIIKDHYTISASSMAGASVLAWMRQVLFDVAEKDRDDDIFQHIEKQASQVPAGSRGMLFLPYIYGERSPFYDPHASGAFWGIKYWHTRADLFRSVFEGVALNIATCYDLLRECANNHKVSLGPIRLGGGGSQVSLWHQTIADCLGLPIHVMRVREAGCLGAALLSGIGIGCYSDHRDAAERTVREDRMIEPSSENYRIYEEKRKKMIEVHGRVH